MTKEIKRFEAKKDYTTRSVCDYNCIFTTTILKRTKKTVLILNGMDKHPIRRKIHIYDNAECIFPFGSYSMAPILRATK